MNLKHLGDALDHWKGSLFDYLREEKVLHDFAVDPMDSDQEQWKKTDFAIYRRLLRIDENQLIRHKSTLADDRNQYFSEIKLITGDLFLDPDTGILTSKVNKKDEKKYIKPHEVASLLQDDRLLAVYQHVRGKVVSERVGKCLDAIKQKTSSFSCCSYESGMAAMLFLSHQPDRTTKVKEALTRLLGKHTKRIVLSRR